MARTAKSKLRHVAIIMDGNGRWAQQHSLPRLDGHRRGADVVVEMVKAAQEINLQYLTLYAFSTENWKRPNFEVLGLMNLLNDFLTERIHELMENGVRLRTIGRTAQLPENVRRKLVAAEKMTADNANGTLVLALSYGGRAEIVDATKKIAEAVAQGKINVATIDENVFSNYLYAPDIPDPDLMIRTSGEMRLSNFLLWQLSYSELFVTDKLWPDFTREDFLQAVVAFNERERRFGKR